MENNLKKNTLINSSNIRHWGCNYFNVNDEGKIIVTPNPDYKELSVELSSICSQIKDSKYPILLNFPQIIQHRLKSINQAFKNAKKEFSYNGEYFLVYPIKVNQHRRVIDALINSGETMGLEAGSKAELLAVLNYSIYTKTVIICNGYKDREYIRIALIGEKLGHKVFLVIEKLSELTIVFEEAKKIGVLPRLGVRARLSSEGIGKWQSSGGEKSKFGLSASQILLLVEKLKENNLLDSLQLLHFHLGSQIANIRDIIKGVRESSRFYVELYKLGVKIKYFDVGGGLGIDYEGTRSKSEFSVNYGLNEYANNIVWGIVEACNNNNLPHPNIITESGRALTTHHSVLVTNVIGIERYNNQSKIEEPKHDDPKELQYLWETLQDLSKDETDRSLREQFHDSQIYLNDIHLQYILGTVDLWQRAHAEKIYLKICQLIKDNLDIYTRANRIIIEEIEERMADKLYLNFSLFKSMPDAWGIEQLFPVLPLTNLNEPISRRVVLLDITCDSDGMIDKYIENDDINKTMPISEYDVDNPPLFGFFLIGSYQEILGNMHNLFGDTVSIDIYINSDGKLEFDGLENGNTVTQMLEYVNLNPKEFIINYKKQIDNTDLSDELKNQFLNDFKFGLSGYTYLEDE